MDGFESLPKQTHSRHWFKSNKLPCFYLECQSISHRCFCATTVDAIPLLKENAAQWDTQAMKSMARLTSLRRGTSKPSGGCQCPKFYQTHGFICLMHGDRAQCMSGAYLCHINLALLRSGELAGFGLEDQQNQLFQFPPGPNTVHSWAP